MAGLHHYKCFNCDFELYSTPWGGDIWMSGYGYYLYCCEDCKKLSKIEHGFSEAAQIEIIERQNPILYLKSADRSTQICISNTCSHCGSKKLVRWKPEDGSCPICNGKLLGSEEPLMQTD